MKILVFSDSHRSRGDMIEAIDEQQPDQVIHLGDLITDAEELTYVYPRLPICMVPGNCDGWTTEPVKKLITLQGKTILLSHGHLWRVKGSYDAAIADARKAGAEEFIQKLPQGYDTVLDNDAANLSAGQRGPAAAATAPFSSRAGRSSAP
mgnify:CR=1 FL=1